MTKSVLIQTLVRQSQEIKILLRSAALNVEFRSYATKLQEERAIARIFANHRKPEKQF